jgi:Ca2+-dependent lipid-binding protein
VLTLTGAMLSRRVQDTKKKTKIIKKTLDPEFNETFEWLLTPRERVS